MPVDLLIRNAHVIDPSQNIDGRADLAISDGVIAALGQNLEASASSHLIEAAGLYLSPGLIDLHGHWYEGGLYGVNAEICLNHGVTTVIDAGTTGFANFPEFYRTAIQTSRVDVFAFVHVSCLGLHAPFAEELLDLRYARPGETAVVVQQHPGRAIGVKVRLGGMTSDPRAALQLALAAAREARVPVMVHISKGAPEGEVLDALRPGDILTHCFHGRGNGMIDDHGLIAQVASARERGVIFDVGHGCGSFSWDTARRAFEHHFYPDTISTDLHRYCVGDPFAVTLPDVMSKFLALGMSLNDVVTKTTSAAAAVLGFGERAGSLRIGQRADAFLFAVEEGEFHFIDTHFKIRRSNRRIRPKFTIKGGELFPAGSVSVPLRCLYECDQQVFDLVRATA